MMKEGGPPFLDWSSPSVLVPPLPIVWWERPGDGSPIH